MHIFIYKLLAIASYGFCASKEYKVPIVKLKLQYSWGAESKNAIEYGPFGSRPVPVPVGARK